MGEPFVNSGESFIRTTGRVSVNFALFDMILTTRHLILVDNTYARFEPQMIPVLNILAVTAGKVATGEPVITLSFTVTGGQQNQAPMNLIFTQEPGEQRKRERDEWIKILIDHIVSARDQTIPAAAPNLKGRGPLPRGATPRPIELAIPHKTSAGSDLIQSEIVILPDEIESPPVDVEDTASQHMPTPVAPMPRETPDSSKTQAPPPKIHEPPAGKALPEYGEEECKIPAPPTSEIKVQEEFSGGELTSKDSFSLAVQAAVTSLVGPQGRTGSPATGTPQTSGTEEPGTFVTPELIGVEPGKYRERRDTITVAGTAPPAPASPPPSSIFGWRPAIVVSALVIIILAVLGGMFLNSPHGPGTSEIPQMPSMTMGPTLPETPAMVVIPGNGVWVRVQNNGSFIGYFGNPGSLHHVGGSGDRFYYIPKSDGLVQATFRKQDNSGSTLTIEVYRDGEMVLHRSTRVPKGEVQVLIDPKTGNPPGVNATAASK